MHGLTDNTIKELKNIFASYTAIEKIVLYGSRAKGTQRDGSDIDLTFFGKELTLAIIYEIEEKIEELNLPYLFDISLFSHIDNKNLVEHIERVGKVFYEKNNL